MLRSILPALFLFGAAAPAPAAEVATQDAVEIREVIAEQLDAFARDDAPRAFLLATRGICAQFGTPEAFMNMVRTGYPVVYRPKSVQFETPVIVDGEVIQPVRMTDTEGLAWIALYPMERQAEVGWRINGCSLERLRANMRDRAAHRTATALCSSLEISRTTGHSSTRYISAASTIGVAL